MKPIMTFFPDELLPKRQCLYRADELALLYEAGEIPSTLSTSPLLAEVVDKQFGLDKPSELLLIADTLTLTFRGADKHLSLLDAHTNRQLWKTCQLHCVPKASGQGVLLAKPDSFDEDRYVLDFTPKYEIASDHKWLRLVLSDDDSEAHYEVASGLIAGMKEGMITEIFLLDLLFL